jgi:hypothetical protein
MTPERVALPGKKGICYSLPLTDNPKRTAAENDEIRKEHIRRMEALNVSWNYSWAIVSVEDQPAGVEFTPMFYGGVQWHGADAEAKLKEELAKFVVPQIEAGKVKRLLGPNEPDREKHGFLSPEKTLELWPALEVMGVPLCSPSAANTEAAGGLGAHWMPEFMKGVEERGLRVDYLGTHAYSDANAEGLKKRLRRIYEKYGQRPLLITEFGVADWKALDGTSKNRYTQAQVLAFMKDVLPWMERQDWIAGYAWFPFRDGNEVGKASVLFDADGKLNALGRYYRSITPENPDGDQSIQAD